METLPVKAMSTRSRRRKQVFLNPDAASTDTCDLKRFTLTKLVNEIWFSDDPNHPTYGNGVIMEYETDSVAALEKYAIVQFKKGCVFDSSKNPARQDPYGTSLTRWRASAKIFPFAFANG